MSKKSITALIYHRHRLLDLIYEEMTKVVRIWKGAIMAYLKILFRKSLREAGESDGELEPG
jgi:hypothetical protein